MNDTDLRVGFVFDRIRGKPVHPANGGIYVTVVGNYSIGISPDNRLIYFSNNPGCVAEASDLGPATISNIKSIEYALERLRIHAIEE